MKNLSTLRAKLTFNLIPFCVFEHQDNKKGIFYFIDYWGVGCCIEYDNKKKYHNFYYPFSNGKRQSIINNYSPYNNPLYLIPEKSFIQYAENIIKKTSKIPIEKNCIFKYMHKGKIYFESGIYKNLSIQLDNTKLILNPDEILGWYLTKSFKSKLKKDFKISL